MPFRKSSGSKKKRVSSTKKRTEKKSILRRKSKTTRSKRGSGSGTKELLLAAQNLMQFIPNVSGLDNEEMWPWLEVLQGNIIPFILAARYVSPANKDKLKQHVNTNLKELPKEDRKLFVFETILLCKDILVETYEEIKRKKESEDTGIASRFKGAFVTKKPDHKDLLAIYYTLKQMGVCMLGDSTCKNKGKKYNDEFKLDENGDTNPIKYIKEFVTEEKQEKQEKEAAEKEIQRQEQEEIDRLRQKDIDRRLAA